MVLTLFKTIDFIPKLERIIIIINLIIITILKVASRQNR